MTTPAASQYRDHHLRSRSDRSNLDSFLHRLRRLWVRVSDSGAHAQPALSGVRPEPWSYLGSFGDDFFDEFDFPLTQRELCRDR